MSKLSKVPNANKIIYVQWIDCITRQGWAYGEDMKDWGLYTEEQVRQILEKQNEKQD